MPVTQSALFIPTWRDILDASQLAVDLDAETHKVALFLNAITPNFSADTAYGAAPYNANEANGTGYTAGGQLLTGTTFTESPTGSLRWDANDPSWAASTITARCGLIYADALADQAIYLIDFGASYATVGSAFSILLPVTGLFAFKLVPNA